LLTTKWKSDKKNLSTLTIEPSPALTFAIMDIASTERDVSICTASRLMSRMDRKPEATVNSHILQKVQTNKNQEPKIQIKSN